MKKLIIISFLLITLVTRAQVVSQFIWSSSPLTTAAIGPNGTSISAQAISVAVGAPVNYAINPGTPSKNIDLLIPGSPYFDIPSIDIDLYFRREENQASFFKRGSVFDFGINGGQLYVNFVTNQGSTPGLLTVSSGNVYTLPNDHAFHHYQFKYDQNSGIANLFVDGAVVYTYNGTPGYALDWSGAGNVAIGTNMDGTGTNVPILGNFTVQNPAQAATLPVSMLSFNANAKNGTAAIDWTTTKEHNISRFIVESSANGVQFSTLGVVAPAGSFNLVRRYQYSDPRPPGSMMYYRIGTVDIDGKITYSDIRKVNFGAAINISCYPNPAVDHVILAMNNITGSVYHYSVFNLNGNVVEASSVTVSAGAQQIRIDLGRGVPSGTLMIKLVNTSDNSISAFKVIKG